MRADDSSPVYFHPLGRNGNSQNCFRVQGNRRLKSLSVTLRRAGQVVTSATGLPSLQDSLTLSICLSCPVSKNSFPNFRLPSCLSIHKAKRIQHNTSLGDHSSYYEYLPDNSSTVGNRHQGPRRKLFAQRSSWQILVFMFFCWQWELCCTLF